jgi:hypothetical protein
MGALHQPTWWAYLWAAPATLLGLLGLGVLSLFGARTCRTEGVLECNGGILAKLDRIPFVNQFAAITVGHVIFANDSACMARLRVHERTHVKQYERWGIFFIPLYLGSSAWQILCGRHYYRDNVFEIEAFAAEEAVEHA